MSYSETKTTIIKELEKLSSLAASESKKLKGEDKKTIIQIGIILKVLSKGILEGNFDRLLSGEKLGQIGSRH